MKPLDMPTLDLAPKHLAELHRLLQKHVPHAEVWAFGSRTQGKAHEGSDLDLVLYDKVHPDQPVVNLSALAEALQNSSLPMLVEVHDGALLPTAFVEEIKRHRVLIHS